MPEDNLAQVPDAPEETTTPSDSPTEINGDSTSPSQGGDTTTNTPDVNENVPFHKHPRWIERQREFDSLKKELDELKPLKSDFEQIRSAMPKPAPEMPDWWKESFGDDDASRAAFQKQVEHEQKLYSDWENRVIEKLRSEQTQKAEQEKAEVEKWQGYIDAECAKLVEEGKVFDRNELLKVVDEFSKDQEGNYTGVVFPFAKAYEILQFRKTVPSATTTARQTAARHSVTGTRSGATPRSQARTIEEIRNRGWGAWRR
jgi:hypothetical protein